MKKIFSVAVVALVAMAFTFVVFAEETKVKEKIKETITPTETTTVVKEKDQQKKETVKIVESAAGTNVKDVTKYKQGDVWKDTVVFQKYEANGDYIYVKKDDKVIRLKHKLSDNVKKDMMKKKMGDKIVITSTRPLSDAEVATIMDLQDAK